jgi:hypothetical protein
MKHAFEAAGMKPKDNQRRIWKTWAQQAARDGATREDWIAAWDGRAVNEMGKSGQVGGVQQDQRFFADLSRQTPSEGHMLRAQQGQGGAADARPLMPDADQGEHVQQDHKSTVSVGRLLPEGQSRSVQQDHHVIADGQPIPSEGQGRSVQQDHLQFADAGNQIAGAEGHDVRAKQGHPIRAPAAREHRKPNKARSLEEVRADRLVVETLFDYRLGGQRIRDLTRDGVIAAHVAAARRLKTSLREAANDAYDYALADQMLKHCQADGKTPTTKMFKLVDLQRFDNNARAMVLKSADAVADNASTYLMQKTMEISHVNAR